MSYILEALKKADAERDRGAVPDLHAQAMLPEAAFEGDARGRAKPWLWLVAGAGTALLAIAAWQWAQTDRPALAAAPAAPSAMPARATDSLPAAVPAGAVAGRAQSATAPEGATRPPSPEGATRPPAPGAAGVAGLAPRQSAIAAATSAAAQSHAATPASKARRGAVEPAAADDKRPAAPAGESGAPMPSGTSPAAAAVPAPKPLPNAEPSRSAGPVPKPAPGAAPKPAAERVPLLAELPPDLQRQVPPMKLGGLVYSAAPASRMVIVNGELQREGSTVAPGLTLERIGPKSIVFSLRGQRFELPI